ncbi:MAG TPA: proline--tRNA ligase [Candidatus Nanoarchaeia archaeon]|nr:proline--tRNA ligase [uncultured archaeon]
MRQGSLFGKTSRQAPAEATAISHQYLVRGGFIDQLMSGVYTFLPLGLRVLKKIENIIRHEMNALGGQEILMPALSPKNLWEETGRWTTIDPPLFKFKDRHDKEIALGPTHEEVITDLVRRRVQSYKDLPFSLYQIQTKFRNEVRSTGGLLRVREFSMKDLYSFHATQEDLDNFFEKVVSAYEKIFARVNLKPIIAKASGGTIGGSVTYEFQVPTKVGEDTVYVSDENGEAYNKDLLEEISEGKKGKFEQIQAVEAGQVFQLGAKYSEAMGANFVEADGTEKPILMGCYGIGLGRLLATIVEVFNDEKGIVWPESVAPFAVHLLSLGGEKEVTKASEEIYEKLLKKGTEVLFDDRQMSAGEKLADSDLIGIPERWIVSEKSLKEEAIEVKNRGEESTKLVKITSI